MHTKINLKGVLPRDQLSRNQLPVNQLPIDQLRTGSTPVKSTSHEMPPFLPSQKSTSAQHLESLPGSIPNDQMLITYYLVTWIQ